MEKTTDLVTLDETFTIMSPTEDINMEFKRLIKYIFDIGLFIVVFNACDEKDNNTDFPIGNKVYWFSANSYVYEYISYDAIDVRDGQGRVIVDVMPPMSSYGANSTDEIEKLLYENMCSLYGDVGYKLTFSTLHPLDSYNHCVQDRNFAKIKIFSDMNFNEDLPAGSDLSSVFYLASRSPYPFIKSGYQNSFILENERLPDYYEDYIINFGAYNFDGGLWPIYGLLSELSAKDLILLGYSAGPSRHINIFWLYPAVLPEEMTIHELTLELTDTNGNILKGSVLFDFSKVKLFTQE